MGRDKKSKMQFSRTEQYKAVQRMQQFDTALQFSNAAMQLNSNGNAVQQRKSMQQ